MEDKEVSGPHFIQMEGWAAFEQDNNRDIGQKLF